MKVTMSFQDDPRMLVGRWRTVSTAGAVDLSAVSVSFGFDGKGYCHTLGRLKWKEW